MPRSCCPRRLRLAGLLLSLAAHAAAADNNDGLALVSRLYQSFAHEIQTNALPPPGSNLIEQPRARLEQFFAPKLTALLLKDRQCVLKTGEICKLDFAPLWASQDPGARDLKIRQGSSAQNVIVSFRYPGNNEKIELNYQLVDTANGVRIADIRYPAGYSLQTLLSAKP